MRTYKNMRKMLFKNFLILVIIITLPRFITFWYARKRTHTIETAPAQRVAIVFGAGLWQDGSPTPVLKDRVSTAVDLYFAGKVEKLLMSGDNRFVEYNEPGAMKDYAMQLGVPAEDIVLDYAGRRTYDTCYRANYIFGLQEALLITQQFHLARTIYTCNKLGIAGEGVIADKRTYSRKSVFYWNIRELPATMVALLQVHFTHPEPVLGPFEPVFPISTDTEN